MSDDPRAIDKGWDALPQYAEKLGDAEDAVTVSISTTPGEWLVNTVDAVVVPMSMIEVVEALRSQKLNERSLVWRAGMQEWAPVDRVPQLKLAARLPSVMPKPSVAPAPPSAPKIVPTASIVPPAATAAPRPANTTKPPPKPVRASSTPQAFAAPSRKATLPFGLPSPLATPSKLPAIATPSKPFQARPTPRPALPPPPSAEDSEVLAVYARPAATISFDLSPEPVRTISAPAPMPPQTLAPTTTDNAPRRARVSTLPPTRPADLSVVAASQFRQAQRFSKRLILASSLGSAAVASLITMWLSHGEAEHRAAAAPPAPVQTLVAPAKPTPPPVVLPPPAAEAPEAVAEPAPEPSPKSKAKPKARARAWQRPVRAAAAEPVVASDAAAPAEPKGESNPYDVQLDDESAAKAKPPSVGHGSGLETEETAKTDPGSPGF
jgi:hypothetical protein